MSLALVMLPTSVNSSSSSAVFAGLFLTGGPDTLATAPPWGLSTKALDVSSDITVMTTVLLTSEP